MYILNGQQRRKRTRKTIVLIVLLLVLLSAGLLAFRHFNGDDTYIGPTPKAVVTKVTDKRGPPKHIDQPGYSFDLPGDWEQYTPPSAVAPAPVASYRNTAKDKWTSRIDIYWDAVPTTLAVNRILPVKANGGRLAVAGNTSDSCEKFASSSNGQPSITGSVKLNWQNVSFLCDTGNYTRYVVGIGEPGGSINSVKVTGAGGSHQLFVLYTDSSASPNDSALASMLDSFEAK